MREIKFRAYRKYSGSSRMWSWEEIRQEMYEEPGVFVNLVEDGYEDCYLMQYTGAVDKNGLGIYEGDIVVCEDPNQTYKWIVQWYSHSNGFGGDLNDRNIEVVGNIHENPELLEKLSQCCGAKEIGEQGRCSDCKELAEFK